MTLTSDLLLVEDDLLLARALKRSLVAKGIVARHVARCATATELDGPFRVGVFDIDLPDGDGVELARRMKQKGIVSHVIFYTACSHPSRLARARDLGTVFLKARQYTSLLDMLAARPGQAAAASTSLH